MIDELNTAIAEYQVKWRALVSGRKGRAFFEKLKPTSVAWKVTDREEYDRLLAELHDRADMIVEKWMNERWIAKVHLKDTKLENGIEIIKLMERRPGSTDAVGLDHLDFYSPAVAQANEILKQEPDLKWTNETNDTMEGYTWISIWFEGTEAKLKTDTVLDIIQAELKEINAHILAKG